MGFKYNHDAVSGLLLDTRNRCNGVMNALQKNEEKAQKVMEGDAWLGNKADNVRDYLGYVYSSINAGFGKAVEALECQVELYNSECLSIDSDKHAVIHENRVKEIEDDFQTFRYKMLPVGDDANRAIQSVADLAQVRRVELSGLERQLDKVQNELTDLVDSINDNETQFEQCFSHDITELIQKTAAFIKYAQGQKDITKFSSSSLSKCKEYQALAAAYNKVSDQLEVDAEKIAKAQKTNDAMVAELQQEYEERVKKAQRLKLLAGIVCVVATVAVSALTCGAGTVVAGAITGAVTGAISSGVGSYADQQIGTLACAGKVDWGKVALKSVEGAVIGGVTGAIGGKFDSVKVARTGFKAFGANVLSATAKKVSQGIAQRGLQAGFDTIEAGGCPLEVIKNSLSSAFDKKAVLTDTATGAVSGIVNEGFRQIEKKNNLFDKKKDSFKNKKMPAKDTQVTFKGTSYGTKTLKSGYHGFTEMISGAGGRFTGTMISSGGDFSASWDSAKSGMAEDFISAASAEMAMETINHIQETRELNKIQKQIDKEAAEDNKCNEKYHDEWAKEGIGVSKNGTPDFKNSDAFVGETKIELSRSSSEETSRKHDYANAYEKMVAEKIIDPNVIKKDKTGIYKIDPDTGKRTNYTVHHLDDYDVKTGTSTVQLVESDAHSNHNLIPNHTGSVSQRKSAYNNHNLKTKMNKANARVAEHKKQELPDKTRSNMVNNKKIFDNTYPEMPEEETVPDSKALPFGQERFTFAFAT